MHSSDPLFQPRGVPRRFEIDDRRGGLKIQSHPAGIRGKKHLTFRVVLEFLDESAALACRYASVKRYKINTQLAQLLARQVGHAFIFAEDHYFAAFFECQFANDLSKFLQLRRTVGLLVVEKR